MSKCAHVYLASMGVKTEYAVGSQNQDFFFKMIPDGHASRNVGHNQNKNCEKLCFCLSKLIGIHGKLNKTEFCCKKCRIFHLGKRPLIAG